MCRAILIINCKLLEGQYFSRPIECEEPWLFILTGYDYLDRITYWVSLRGVSGFLAWAMVYTIPPCAY